MSTSSPETGASPIIHADSEIRATATPLLDPEQWMGFYRGYIGANRSDGYCQIEAENDLEAVVYWLRKTTTRSKATLESFTRESNRFLAWAAVEHGKRLTDITGSDLYSYQNFLGNPQPASRWIGKRGRLSQEDQLIAWRPPFSGPLTQSSRTTSMRILQSLFGFLHKVAYHRGDPFSVIHIDTVIRQQSTTVRRYLSSSQWSAIKDTLQAMPRESILDNKRYHRTRWVLFLFYLSGIRRSEMVGATMNSFIWRPEGRVLHVVGKGRKERDIPATIRLIQELEIYRHSLGLSGWPEHDDSSPLVRRIVEIDLKEDEHNSGGICSATINRIIKDLFVSTADCLSEVNVVMASELRRMSPHWLRHTYGTELLEHGQSLEVVQDNLGHESINTTRLYSKVKEKNRAKITEVAFAGLILTQDSKI